MNFLPNPSADYNQYTSLIPEDVKRGLVAGLIGSGLSAMGVGGGDGTPTQAVPAPSTAMVVPPTPNIGTSFVNGLNNYSNKMLNNPQQPQQPQQNAQNPIADFVNRIVPYSNR